MNGECMREDKIRQQKKALRREMKAKREQVGKEDYLKYAVGIEKMFCERIDMDAFHWFFLYLPVGKELSTWKIVETLWRKKKNVAVPKVDVSRKEPVMHFYPVRDRKDVTEGFHGILEPEETGEIRPDEVEKGKICMLLPGLAFSLEGDRMGYGGGYYDCYLSRYADCGIRTYGLCYDFQLCGEVITEPADWRLDEVLACGKGEKDGK